MKKRSSPAELEGLLAVALEQQAATSDVLRAIRTSPTDPEPVFEMIAERAMALCSALHGQVCTFDGHLIHVAAHVSAREAFSDALRCTYPIAPSQETAEARAILTRSTVHIADLEGDPEYELTEAARAAGFRSALAVPMLRDGNSIGAIAVVRGVAAPFSDQQVQLLETFADLAVIALENVRFAREREAHNRALVEALEQQKATGEVLKIISGSAFNLEPVLAAVVESATRLCGATRGHIFRWDGELLNFAAAYGAWPGFTEHLKRNPVRPGRGSIAGRAALERQTIHVADVRGEEGYEWGELVRQQDYRAVLAVPMLREEALVGVITILKSEAEPFTDKQVALVETFADQAVIAIENARLFAELEARNKHLTEALERQSATDEILRVISRSPTDTQPVFATIVESARRLCGADSAAVFTYRADLIHIESIDNVSPKQASALRDAYPMPANRGHATGRAILTGRPVHIPDVRLDPEFALEALRDAVGLRTILSVPMLRDGAPIGAITLQRWGTPSSFADDQVALLQTFADQAVIAIENVRLFKALDARTHELTRSVGKLEALGEVSQAVSSTLDLETVLATIVSHAVELSSSHGGIAYEFDEDTQSFHARTTHGLGPEFVEAIRSAPIRLGEGAIGRAGVLREPVQVLDVAREVHLVAAQVRGIMVREGMRSLVAIPFVREHRLLGGLVIIRREQGAFSDEAVAMLQTFAAQSVVAIRNAGLFREIQRQKQYADALVRTSPVAIVTMDMSGAVAGWNPAAERLFGYSPDEAIGRRMEGLIAVPGGCEEIRSNIAQTLSGTWLRAIAQRARKDGTLVDVEISSMPVSVDGREVGIIAIFHDITALLAARREAEAANEAKSAFLATMSHEIRTPMNAVIGMSGLLLNTRLTDEQREYAEVIRQSGDALLTVINDILDFSKIEAGKLELESQPFDLRECVEGALDLVATRAAEKELDLAYLIADGTPAGIVGDVTRLRQVLLNLLSNAVKFTERGEIVLSVAGRPVGAAPLHELTFSVRDTGIGIPKDRLGRLFRSFSQIDASTTRRYGGTGLGLAISQRLTELMGGRIEVASEVGVGSEFRFSIRAAAIEAPMPTRRDWSGVQPSLAGKRVLVVDDNATNRRILVTHLDRWGMDVRATEWPRQALEWIARGERFDLGILDMHMPQMDGVALARAVRQHAAGSALPLVLFTSLGRREARAEEAGFAAYLNKPIKPSQLFDVLATVFAGQPIHVPRPEAPPTELDPDMARRHPLRILLAEDNVVNQKLALRLLAQMGYRADLAANGLEAIDAIARQPYDVVLMDVQMPELDGFEASREIRRRWPDTRRPRIVAMTANAMQGDRELCEAAGMEDYIAKPIRVAELVAALGRCRRLPEAARPVAPGRDAGGVGATRAAIAGDSDAIAIDRAAIEALRASMGAEFARELIDAFVDDGRALVATLSRGPAGDPDGFRRAAHSLKSNAETVGATGLAALARQLEAMARTGDLQGAGEQLESLGRAYDVAAGALQEIGRGLAA